MAKSLLEYLDRGGAGNERLHGVRFQPRGDAREPDQIAAFFKLDLTLVTDQRKSLLRDGHTNLRAVQSGGDHILRVDGLHPGTYKKER